MLYIVFEQNQPFLNLEFSSFSISQYMSLCPNKCSYDYLSDVFSRIGLIPSPSIHRIRHSYNFLENEIQKVYLFHQNFLSITVAFNISQSVLTCRQNLCQYFPCCVSGHCSCCCWRNYLKLKTSLRGLLNTTPMRDLIAWPIVELEKYTWKKTG